MSHIALTVVSLVLSLNVMVLISAWRRSHAQQATGSLHVIKA